jgi:Rrf2 family protein
LEITRRTDYAIRILMELARVGGGPLSVREIAERGEVPYSFARSIQRELGAAGLIDTLRGAKGGICLARPAEEISLLDVADATQSGDSCSVCTRDPGWCSRMGGCGVHKVWDEVDALVRGHLGSKSIGELVGKGEEGEG